MIETPRLILRPHPTDGVDALAHILRDPVTMHFWPRPFTHDEVGGWIERNSTRIARDGRGRRAIILRETGELIGDCGVMPSVCDGMEVNDLGYILHHRYWGNGYATEAARAVVEHAFSSLRLDVLHANMAHDNTASRRVAERIGMQYVRTFANARNRDIPTLLYVLRRDEGTSNAVTT